jgi:hypothetical protein
MEARETTVVDPKAVAAPRYELGFAGHEASCRFA